MNRTISAWQTGIILFVMMFANKILLLPSLLYESAKMGALFVPIFLFLLELFMLVLFFFLKRKYEDLSLREILKKCGGNFLVIAIFSLFVIYFFGKMVLIYNITYVFFKELIYKDSTNIMFLVCFLPVIMQLALSDFRVIGRTFQFFFPIILLVTIFVVVVGIFGIDHSSIILHSPTKSVFECVLKYTSAFGDSIFLFVMIDKIDIKKGQWKIFFSFAFTAIMLIVAIVSIFLFSYTYTSFMHKFALFEIVAFVKEYVGVGRIDIVSMLLVVILTYLHLAIYLKIFVESASNIFPKLPKKSFAIFFSLLFSCVVSFIPMNLEKSIVFGEIILPYFSIFTFIIFPFLCIAFLCKKGVKT